MHEALRSLSLAPDQGEVFPTLAGGKVTFKVRARDSSGKVSIAEFEVPAGAGPRLHVHEESHECIYVLHGELRVELGGEVVQSQAGSCVFIPAGLPHRFENVGQENASLLAVYTPGGIETFFESLHPVRTEVDKALDGG